MTVLTNNIQLGSSVNALQNFTITSEAADGTMKIARGNYSAPSQDILTVSGTGQMSASLNPATGLRSTALATMQKFADEFGASLINNNGYQKLPSGLIIQWVRSANVAMTAATQGTISSTLPIAFPTAVLFAIPAAFVPTATVNGVFLSSLGGTLTTVSAACQSASAQSVSAMFLAIGY